MKKLKHPFNKIIIQLQKLQQHEDILGLYVFGSVARGEATINSDVDVKVMVKDGCIQNNVSHPVIHGKKIDISFFPEQYFIDELDKEVKDSNRKPFIAESLILFDKTGTLNKLRQKALKVKPKKVLKKEIPWIKFMVEHMDDKAKRHLDSDPLSSLLAMNINLNDLLKFHYQINRKWWVSNKRLLSDLRKWDLGLAKMIEKFLQESDVNKKYKLWGKIAEHIMNPIGGRQPIFENNCKCKYCKKYLEYINNSLAG